MLQPGLYHSLFHHYANSLYMLHIFIHWKCQVNPATYSISQHAPQLPNTANSMDAADELDWQQAIMVHRQLMGKQWQDIADLNTKIDLLSQAIAIAPPWITMPQHSSPPMPAPEKFSGDISQCKGFLLRCSLNNTRFLNLLTGRLWNGHQRFGSQELVASYQHFSELICHVFDHSLDGEEVGEQLLTLTQ